MSASSLPSDLDVSRERIEQLVGRPVDDVALYRRALIHRSLLREHPEHSLQSNERLEFLGDAFLDLVIGEVLYHRFPEKEEGYLTRLRAKLVSTTALARYAKHMSLGPHLLMSSNAARTAGRENPNILADAFEALVGALYLDQGAEAARAFVHERALSPFDLEEVVAHDENYKSMLLEWLQARGRPQPAYRVIHEEGPSHDKKFTVEVVVGDTSYEQGTASNKQEAEQRAAQQTLEELQRPSRARDSSP